MGSFFLIYMCTFFYVLYGLFLCGFYGGSFFWTLYRLNSVRFYMGSFFWILYGLVLLGSRWTLSFGFYMVSFFGFFLLGSVLALSFGFYRVYSGVGLPGGPVARGQPKGRRASQSHIMAGPVGQP